MEDYIIVRWVMVVDFKKYIVNNIWSIESLILKVCWKVIDVLRILGIICLVVYLVKL